MSGDKNPRYYHHHYDPHAREPFFLSRAKIELFVECPCCFYLHHRLGIKRPGWSGGLSLNLAVDALLKKEFDAYRREGRRHPIMQEYRINAIPFAHPDLDTWRDNFKGVQFLDPRTNLMICGAVDDVWVYSNGQLIVVDYKATSTDKPIDLRGLLGATYRRQMEIYQWLLRKNGFSVSPQGYFVYANARKDVPDFHNVLNFSLSLIPYEGNSEWISGVISDIHECLNLPVSELPPPSVACSFCAYYTRVDITLPRDLW
ncbi:MAG: PD-(D/E)XK nuclease family protein [Patescibacteria group bacterium]|nr:PD-(D/E)XK nuclease family protein [Patescibacteria group bacterium]MDE2438601.1 PD-(D/E)XK nuclease family protein [Patescibacteria group bacterium]